MKPLMQGSKSPTLSLLALLALSGMAHAESGPHPVNHWIKKLDDLDPKVRLEAVKSLGEMKAAAARALPRLREILRQDQDRDVRRAAASALIEIDPRSPTNVRCLTAALHDRDGEVRGTAARVLGSLGPIAGPAVETLATALRDDPGMRRTAARALGQLGPTARAALEPLSKTIEHSEDDLLRLTAIWAVARISKEKRLAMVERLADALKKGELRGKVGIIWDLGSLGPAAEPAIGALTDALHDENAQVREVAAVALSWIPQAGKQAVKSLPPLLEDRDVSVRRATVKALAWLRPNLTAGLTTRLIDVLRDSDTGVRREAIRALANIGPSARVAVPSLAHLAQSDPNSDVRREALEALGKVGPKTGATAALMEKGLRDKDPWVRASAARAIGELGPNAKGTVESLIAALHDREAVVRLNAIWALETLGPVAQRALPSLTQLLQDKDAHVHMSAAEALAHIEPRKKAEMLQLVLDNLGDKNPGRRVAASRVVSGFGPALKNHVDRLVEALNDPDPDIRQRIIHTLAELGPNAKAAVDPLQRRLNDADYVTRLYAAWALARISREKAPEMVKRLIAALDDPDRDVRGYSVFFLEDLGPLAKAAVGPLTEALAQDDVVMQKDIVRALRKIDPRAAKRAGLE